MNIFIADAIAATETTATTMQPQGGGFGFLFMLVMMLALLYFVVWRPQSKRVKEHRTLLEKLVEGDEIVTNGGIFGVIQKINDNFVTLMIGKNVEIKIQKSAIAAVMPKGTAANE